VIALGLAGCPEDTNIANGEGGGSAGDGGEGGSGGSDPGGSGGSGSGTGGRGGTGGSSSECDPNAALPAICQVCPDGSCASPACMGGEWVFVCEGGGTAGMGGGAGGDPGTGDCDPNAAIPAICQLCDDGSCAGVVCENGEWVMRCAGQSGGCARGGCSSQLCVEASQAGGIVSTCEWRDEYACYQAAPCERQADGQCGHTQTPELLSCLGGSGGGLRWFSTCGDPVCQSPDPAGGTGQPQCPAGAQEGGACTQSGTLCDANLGCGANLVCASSDPTQGPGGCPISRARYKKDIEYLDDAQRQSYHEQLVRMPLASYLYKQNEGAGPQLGFIIDDIEPSVAVSGNHVNMYGYLSMAVAAIQVQQAQIATLRAELSALRATVDPNAAMCGQ
jgi:hypothetical protein